jgi:DUF4097 and DUF4098 domain-containing protein YvlB
MGHSGRGGTIIENIKNEIEFNGCHSIELKNVTGPLVVSTISGGVKVVFSEISKDKPISLASISGEVDVTVPAKAALDLEMSTISGGMFTAPAGISISGKRKRKNKTIVMKNFYRLRSAVWP